MLPAEIVVVGPPAPPLTGPIGFSLAYPSKSKAPDGSGMAGYVPSGGQPEAVGVGT